MWCEILPKYISSSIIYWCTSLLLTQTSSTSSNKRSLLFPLLRKDVKFGGILISGSLITNSLRSPLSALSGFLMDLSGYVSHATKMKSNHSGISIASLTASSLNVFGTFTVDRMMAIKSRAQHDWLEKQASSAMIEDKAASISLLLAVFLLATSQVASARGTGARGKEKKRPCQYLLTTAP